MLFFKFFNSFFSFNNCCDFGDESFILLLTDKSAENFHDPMKFMLEVAFLLIFVKKTFQISLNHEIFDLISSLNSFVIKIKNLKFDPIHLD